MLADGAVRSGSEQRDGVVVVAEGVHQYVQGVGGSHSSPPGRNLIAH